MSSVQENQNDETKQYIIFHLNNEEYGIEIQQVQTIERMMSITRVPKTQRYLKGVINLRGEIVPVMSLRDRFELGEDQYTEHTRIIIINTSDALIGLIVDEVQEVLEFSSKMIENVQNNNTEIEQRYIFGVGKTDDRVITLLNMEHFSALLEVE